MTIQGSFFNRSEGDYSCEFHLSGTTLPSPYSLTPVGWRDVVCIVPRWPRWVVAGPTNVSVLLGNESMPTSTDNPLQLLVYAEWTGLSGCNGTNLTNLTANASADEAAGLRALDDICNLTEFANGGFSLEVFAWGLDPMLHHELHFTDDVGNIMQAQLTVTSSSTGSFERAHVDELPVWPFPATKTRVSLHQFDRPSQDVPANGLSKAIPDQGGAVYFTFDEIAESVSLQWHRENCQENCWPSSVTVSGYAFQNTSASARFNRGDFDSIYHPEYSCTLTGLDVNESVIESSFVTIISPESLRCYFGLDGDRFPLYVSQNFSLVLEHNGAAVQWTSPEPRVVFLSEAWTGLTCRGSRWCTARASGGEEMQVQGYGFNDERQYRCLWSRNGAESMWVNATVVSSEELTCIVPDWGWEEGPVDFSIQLQEQDGTISTVLRDESSPVLPNMRLEATWWFAELQEGYVTGGQTAVASPGTNDAREFVALTGRGFDPSATYRVRFHGVSSVGVAAKAISDAFAPQNVTHLLVRVPAFPGAEGFVDVVLLRCDASGESCAEIPSDANPSLAKPGELTDTFRFLSVWRRAAMPMLMEAPHGKYCVTGAAVECWAPATGDALLELVGTGFSEIKGSDEPYRCLLRDEGPGGATVYADAEVASSGLLRCRTPAFPNGSLAVAVGVFSPFSGELSLVADAAPVPLYVETTVASVQPTRGPASGSLVTVQGIGFDSTPGAYACIFYRSHPAGHSWLPYQSAHVVADFLSPREVICNTSGAWSGAGFSAGLTRVAVEHVVGDSAELVAPLDKWAVEAEIILPSAVAEHLYVGVYVSIGEEALLVTGMNTTTVVVLNLVRAKLGTQRREHAAGEVLHVYVPLSWGAHPHEFELAPAVTHASHTSLLAAGGERLRLSGGGFTATLLAAKRELALAGACAPDGQWATPIGLKIGYTGLAFDIRVERELSVTGLQLEALRDGPLDVWVLARRRSTCGGEGKTCSHWDFETNLDFWELVTPNPISVVVNGSASGMSRRPIDVSLPPFALAAGETRGFLAVSNGTGLRFAVPQLGDECKTSADALLEVHAGRAVFGRSIPPGSPDDALLATEGDVDSLRAPRGAVSYQSHEVAGDVYRCRFTSAEGREKLSGPTRAFAARATHLEHPTMFELDGATTLDCVVPQWPWPETEVGLTVLGELTGEVLFYEPGASVGSPLRLPMRASWRELVAPARTLSEGGRPITLRGAGFNISSAHYKCQFSMDDGAVHRTPAVAVRWSEAVCATPIAANSTAGVARVDLVGGVYEPAVWEAMRKTVPYTAGNVGSHSCDGHDCAVGNAAGGACLPQPCLEVVYSQESGNFSRRTIQLLENVATVQPREVPSAGGTALTVSGQGFLPDHDAYGARYMCTVSLQANDLRKSNFSYSIDATPDPDVPTSRLTCATPQGAGAWGARFPGTTSLAQDQSAVVELLRRDWGSTLSMPLSAELLVPAIATVQGLLPVGYTVVALEMGAEQMAVGTPVRNGSALLFPVIERGAFGTMPGNHSAGEDATFLVRVNRSSEVEPRVALVTSWAIAATSPLNNTYAGLTVTLSGSGFNVSHNYRFNLRLASGRTALSSQFAAPTSPFTLVLTTGPWTSTERAAELQLVDHRGRPVCAGGETANCDGVAGIEGFVTSWSRLQPHSILARAGEQLTVHGLGFSPGGTEYACVLYNHSGNDTVVPATSVSPTSMLCVFPLWDRAASAVAFTVRDGSSVLVRADGAPKTLPIFDGWDRIDSPGDSTTPVPVGALRRMRASGGASVEVVGYGFAAGEAGYRCVFSQAGDGAALETPARASNSTRLMCAFPSWGSTLTAVEVQLSIYRGDRRLNLTLGGPAGDVPCAGSPVCSVYAAPVWTRVTAQSPVSGSAFGGQRITVVGAGFDPSHNYTCSFRRFGARADSAPAAPNSTTELVCVTPWWRSGGGRAALHIEGPRAEVERAGAAFEFDFRPSWTGMHVSRAPAAGGVVLTISGAGFYPAPVRYECSFSRAGGPGAPERVQWLADHVDSETLACVVRPWLFRQGAVRFALSQGVFDTGVDPAHPGAAELRMALVPYDPPLPGDAPLDAERALYNSSAFEFYAGWTRSRPADGPDDAIPPAGGWQLPAGGNTSLLIDSFGLDVNSTRAQYQCVFAHSGGGELKTPARVITSALLTCATPAWGASFAAASGGAASRDLGLTSLSVALEAPAEPEQEALGVPLFDEGFHEVPTAPCEAATCRFVFGARWTQAADLEDGSRRVAARGGATLRVRGSGFDTQQQYFCHFSRGASAAQGPSALPVNSEELLCGVPEWQYDAGGVMMRVVSVGGEELPYLDGRNATTVITYVADWAGVNTTAAPAKGGKPLFVTGFGFDVSSAEYACRFNLSTSMFLETAAVLVSRTLLRCPSPRLVPAQEVAMSLVDKDGVTLLNRVGEELPTVHTLDVYAGWDGRQDSNLHFKADGGVELELDVYGLGEGAYTCTFTAVSPPYPSARVNASVVDPGASVLCVLPAWGESEVADELLLQLEHDSVPLAFTADGFEPVSVTEGHCGATDCLLDVLPVAASLSVTSGSNEGGSSITVRGFGFSSSATHTCVFGTGEERAVADTSRTQVVSPTAMKCVSPAWPFSTPATVTFQITGAVAGAETLRYTFVDNQYWIGLHPAAAPAKGGTEIVVQGKGFVLGAADYRCVFATLDAAVTASSSATVLTHWNLSCVLPYFDVEAQPVALSLEQGADVIEFTGTAGGSGVQLVSGWDGVDGATGAPLPVSAVGSSNVTLITYALRPGAQYTCRFLRPAASELLPAEELETLGVVLDPSVIFCPSPEWGLHYSAGELAGAVSLELRDAAGDVVPFTGGALATLNTSGCAGTGLQERCAVLFLARWDPKHSIATDRALSAAGGDSLAINGAGFNPAQTYVCEISWLPPGGGTGHVMQSVHGVASDISTLECVTDAWAFRHVPRVELSVREDGAGTLLEPLSAPGGNLSIWQGYTYLAPVNASARGGEVITVHGFGFDSDGDYWCVLAVAGYSAPRVRAAVLSSTVLKCTLATWLAPAQLAGLALLYSPAGAGESGEVSVVAAVEQDGVMAPAQALPQMLIFTEWGEVQPPFADRLGKILAPLAPSITVHGHGFRPDHTYRCVLDENLEASVDVPMPPVRLVNLDSDGCGRLEVFWEDVWGTVCDDQFGDREATVVCRQLLFSYAGTARGGAYRGQGSGPVWLDSVACEGSPDSILLCSADPFGVTDCGHDEDVAVCCAETRDTVRLADLDSNGCGRVEVRHVGVWGTVCDNFWDDDDGAVVCRHLGLSLTGRAERGAFNGEGAPGAPIWMDDVLCTGGEKFLEDCMFAGWGTHDCTHEEDASVCCTADPALRLQDTNDEGCGRLEVLHAGEWGTVCDEGFSELSAIVACRHLGLSATGRVGFTVVGAGENAPVVWTLAARAEPAAYAGEGSGTVWLSGVECDGTERFLHECVAPDFAWGASEPGTCGHAADVAVCCPPLAVDREARSAPATVVSSEELTCEAPEWDARTQWGDYVDRPVRLRVHDETADSWVAPLTGTGALGVGELALVHVNRVPAFADTGLDVVLHQAGEARSYTFANWSRWVVAGEAVDGGADFTELPQQVSFTIEPLTEAQTEIFETMPAVSPRGELSLVVKADHFGLVHLRATLKDDGGSAHGGHDNIERTFDIRIEPRSATSLSDSREISVAEGSGMHIIEGFIHTIFDRRWDKSLNRIAYKASSEADYFDVQPSIDAVGALRFKSGEGRFGRVNITVTLADENLLSGVVEHVSAIVPLHIMPVNSKPTFDAPPLIAVHEDEYLRNSTYSAPWVTLIKAGPDMPQGPHGEFWDESSQSLTFTLERVGGPLSIFAIPPAVSGDGILSFTLARHQSGNATFAVRVRDSGGVEYGGIDTSDTMQLTIAIISLNDAPVFAVNCDAPVAEGVLNCNAACRSGDVVGCKVALTVDENCANCPEHDMPGGCVGGFLVPNFVSPSSISASKYSGRLEATQQLSFVFAQTEGEDFLFHTPPAIDPRSGDLTFCLAGGASGNASFLFNLTDDGGTARGGIASFGPVVLSLRVYPVNQAPSFSICAETEAAEATAVGDFCSRDLPLWQSARLQRMNSFVTGILNGAGYLGLPAGFGDEEAEQSSTFSLAAASAGEQLLASDIHLEQNGDLVVRANTSGSQNLTLTLTDDGAAWDAAAGTQAHSFASGVTYAGVDNGSRDFTLYVIDSYLHIEIALVRNVSVTAGTPGPGPAPACDSMNGTCAMGLNATHLQRLARRAAEALALPPALVRPFRAEGGGLTLDALGTSFRTTLDLEQQLPAVELALRAWDRRWGMAVTLVGARVRGWDHVPAFTLSNATLVLTGVPGNGSMHTYEAYSVSRVTFADFLVGITSPEHSPLGADGNERAPLTVTPIRLETLRSPSFHGLHLSPASLMSSGPNVTARCVAECIPDARASLSLEQNPRAYGLVEYEVRLDGTDVAATFTIESRMLLNLVAPPLVTLLEDVGGVVLVDAVFVEGVPGPAALQGCSFDVSVVAGAELFDAAPAVVASPNGTAGKHELRFAVNGNVFGNATARISAQCDDPDAHGWLRESIDVTIQILAVNDAPHFEFDCAVEYHIRPSDVHAECIGSCGGVAPRGGCGIVLNVEENCAGCLTPESPVALPGCDFPIVVRGFAKTVEASDSSSAMVEGQALNFSVTAIDAPAAAHILDPRHPALGIDVVTGTLFGCLAVGRHGTASFNVTLRDSGGRAFGGADESWSNLTLKVTHVNQRPSFQLVTPHVLGAFDEVAAPGFEYQCSGFRCGNSAREVWDPARWSNWTMGAPYLEVARAAAVCPQGEHFWGCADPPSALGSVCVDPFGFVQPLLDSPEVCEATLGHVAVRPPCALFVDHLWAELGANTAAEAVAARLSEDGILEGVQRACCFAAPEDATCGVEAACLCPGSSTWDAGATLPLCLTESDVVGVQAEGAAPCTVPALPVAVSCLEYYEIHGGGSCADVAGAMGGVDSLSAAVAAHCCSSGP